MKKLFAIMILAGMSLVYACNSAPKEAPAEEAVATEEVTEEAADVEETEEAAEVKAEGQE